MVNRGCLMPSIQVSCKQRIWGTCHVLGPAKQGLFNAQWKGEEVFIKEFNSLFNSFTNNFKNFQ